MRVIVTGHKGYIGAILVPKLLKQGHQVVGIDSDLYRDCTFGDSLTPVPEIIKDIRDVQPQDLEGFEAVIHLAGLSNDPLGDLNPTLTYEINYHASVRLAKLAKEVGINRFLFSSSCSTYGAAGDDLVDENAKFNPVTPYGKSKELVERDVSKLADSKFSPTFLRNATAYGVSPRIRFDLVLNNMVAWAVATGNVYLKSDGSPWRPIVHIEDISEAFITILQAPLHKIHNQAFNIGRTEENYRIKELAEIVTRVIPGSKMEFAPNAGPDKRTYRVNCEKIKQILPEFKPTWTAEHGAEEIYSALKSVQLNLNEFEGSRYSRIAQIKHLIALGRLDDSLRWKDD